MYRSLSCSTHIWTAGVTIYQCAGHQHPYVFHQVLAASSSSFHGFSWHKNTLRSRQMIQETNDLTWKCSTFSTSSSLFSHFPLGSIVVLLFNYKQAVRIIFSLPPFYSFSLQCLSSWNNQYIHTCMKEYVKFPRPTIEATACKCILLCIGYAVEGNGEYIISRLYLYKWLRGASFH